jgi:hypothetical protein
LFHRRINEEDAVVAVLSVMLVVQARSAAFARLESYRHADKSDNLLLHLLRHLEKESPGTVKDEWDKITVKTKSGETLVFPLHSREGVPPWTK